MVLNIATPKPVLVVREGITFANSRNVAGCFNKRHDNVLRDIERIIATGVLKSEETPWFVEVAVTSSQNGQTYREFEMTREGFDILVMGWTGEKAMQFKVLYIREFHAMAEALRQGTQAPSFLTVDLFRALRNERWRRSFSCTLGAYASRLAAEQGITLRKQIVRYSGGVGSVNSYPRVILEQAYDRCSFLLGLGQLQHGPSATAARLIPSQMKSLHS